jgi:hypothetical protein
MQLVSFTRIGKFVVFEHLTHASKSLDELYLSHAVYTFIIDLIYLRHYRTVEVNQTVSLDSISRNKHAYALTDILKLVQTHEWLVTRSYLQLRIFSIELFEDWSIIFDECIDLLSEIRLVPPTLRCKLKVNWFEMVVNKRVYAF